MYCSTQITKESNEAIIAARDFTCSTSYLAATSSAVTLSLERESSGSVKYHALKTLVKYYMLKSLLKYYILKTLVNIWTMSLYIIRDNAITSAVC
jgi:isoprenylcysteine carboxyl methyltransferase (ICMT) family protein YpbQ